MVSPSPLPLSDHAPCSPAGGQGALRYRKEFPIKDHDGILALLQDIKDILYGIALLLAGGLLCVAGILLGGLGILLSAVGVVVLLAGLIYARNGYNHHEVVEKQD